MKGIALYALAGLLSSAVPIAQAAAPFDGTWTAAWTDPSGGSGSKMLAEFVLDGSAGTWKWIMPSRQSGRSPCANLAFPITAEAAGPGALTLHLDESKTIRGCSDFTVTVKAGDEKSFEGHFKGGTPIRFTRQ